MNFFFFLTLAIVSASYLDPMQILKDPRMFVSSIANADPAVVSQLVNYAQSLIQEGEDVRTHVIALRDDADAAAAVAASELTAASEHLDLSVGEQADAQAIFITKTEEEAASRVVMDDAFAHLVDSQNKFDKAQNTMTEELARIAQEDTDLKYVQSLLSPMLPALIQKSLGRKLLNEEDVSIDPKALQNVIDLVDNLIEQGQVDKAKFTKDRDDAQDVLTAATDDHNTKRTLHTHSVGAKAVALEQLNRAKTKTTNAQNSKSAAEANKAAKDSHAADAEAHRDAEEKRINSERADFERVIDLLNSL